MSTIMGKMRPRSLRSKASLRNFRAAAPTAADLDIETMPSMRYTRLVQDMTAETPAEDGSTSRRTRVRITKPSASLEGLPDELKICVLQQMPDLDTLFTFLSSSVPYDCCYARYRQPILHAILLRELGPEVFFEARVVVEARKIQIRQGQPRMDDVKDFIAKYKQKRRLPVEDKVDAYPLDVAALLKMTSLHYHVGVITYNFSRTALSINPNNGKLDRSVYERRPPTANELRRIQRALYRFELFVVLFRGGEYGMWYPEAYQQDAPFFDPVDITELFFALYQPWEVAEIGCVRDFAMGTYDRIFRQCAVELEEMEDERDAVMSGRRRNSASVFFKHCARKMRRKDSRAWRTAHKKEFCLSQGLAFLHTAARAQSPSDQVAILEPFYYDWYGGLSDALSEAHDYLSFRTANAVAAQLATKPLPPDASDPFFVEGLSAPGSSSHPAQSSTQDNTFWDDDAEVSEDEADGDDTDSTSISEMANPGGKKQERIELPTFRGDDDPSSCNALWPLTLGFCWDRWLRHWAYVMWDAERLEAMQVVKAPYYGRRLFDGNERRAGTMSLVWRTAKQSGVTPLVQPVAAVSQP